MPATATTEEKALRYLELDEKLGRRYPMDPYYSVRLYHTLHAPAIAATLGQPGRLLGLSKTGYRETHPNHAVVFNANVCLPDGKVWYGDIDLTTDEPLLADLAARTGQIIHLLYEWDARFRNEDQPQLGEAVYSITPSGHTRFDDTRFERRLDGQVYERRHPRPPR